ncbi:hypothetical protein D3C79_868740 [compost metagenome]
MTLFYFALELVQNVLHIPAGFGHNTIHALKWAVVILAVYKAHPVVELRPLPNRIREQVCRCCAYQHCIGRVVLLCPPNLGMGMPPVPRRIPLHKDSVKRTIGDHIDWGMGKLHLTRQKKVWVLAGDIYAASTRTQSGQTQGGQLPEGDCLVQTVTTLSGQ